MHFSEMGHLPYRYSSFHSYFGCSLPCMIDNLFKILCFMSSINLSLVVFLCHPPILNSVIQGHLNVDYSLLYLVRLYINGDTSYQKLIFDRVFYSLHALVVFFMIILLFLSFGTFTSLESFVVLH